MSERPRHYCGRFLGLARISHRFTAAALAGLILLAALPAGAGGPPSHTSIGVGRYDQDDYGINFLWFDQGKEAGSAEAWELRLEQRYGGDAAWAATPYLHLRPFASLDVAEHGSTWLGGGGVAELLTRPLVFGISLGAGLFDKGNGKDLGFPLEFRTGLEAGLALETELRITAGFYHLSNSEIRPDNNPGANILLLYLHLPTDWVF